MAAEESKTKTANSAAYLQRQEVEPGCRRPLELHEHILTILISSRSYIGICCPDVGTNTQKPPKAPALGGPTSAPAPAPGPAPAPATTVKPAPEKLTTTVKPASESAPTSSLAHVVAQALEQVPTTVKQNDTIIIIVVQKN